MTCAPRSFSQAIIFCNSSRPIWVTRAAAYELATASGRNYKPGDQISYYIKATPKKVAAYEAAKLASEFDPQNRDENVDYYISKLGELVKKFASVMATVSGAKQESLAF